MKTAPFVKGIAHLTCDLNNIQQPWTEKKGDPTTISKELRPQDHQMQCCSWPFSKAILVPGAS